MIGLRGIIWIVSAIVAIGSPCIAQDAPAGGGLPARADGLLLKGSVEHSDSLPPVEAGMRSGLVFDESHLPKEAAGNSWHWIPDWYAGHWHTDYNTCFFVRDLRTGMSDRSTSVMTARSDEDVGAQVDSEGSIWEYEGYPYVQHVDGGQTFEVQIIRRCVPEEVTPARVVMRYTGTRIQVATISRRITRVNQVESLQTYTAHGRGYVQCVSSIKSFDSDGKPYIIQRNVSLKVRTAPFARSDRFKGKDLRKSFREFLISKGLEHLVPADIEAAYAPRGLRATQGRLVVVGR